MAIPSLYWRSLDLASEAIESDSDIWNVIQAEMKDVGLSNVQKNPSDVNGHSQDTIVAVTFVKLKQHSYRLLIMSAGNHAFQLRDQVYEKLKDVHFL